MKKTIFTGMATALVTPMTANGIDYEMPILKGEDRKYVDKVIPQTSMNKMDAYKTLGFDVLFHGSDWKGSDMYNKIIDEFAQVDVDVVFLQHTDGISSTLIREKTKNI